MNPYAPATALALLASLPLAFGPFARATAPADRNPLNPARLFLIYLVLQLGVAGLITIFVGRLLAFGPSPTEYPADYFKTSLLYLLALVGFNAGYWSTSRRPSRLPLWAQAPWSPARQTRLGLFLYGAGYVSAFLLVQSLGGLGEVLANREILRSVGFAGKGFLIYPMTVGTSLGMLLLLDRLVLQPPGRRRSVLIGLLIVLAVLPPLLTGFRGQILLSGFIAAIFFHQNVRSMVNRRGLAIFSLVLVVFTAYGVYREFPPGLDPVAATEYVAEENPTLFFGPLTRVAGLETSTQIVQRMDRDPRIENEWFWPSVYESLTIGVPLALWPDKPESRGIVSGEVFFLNDLRLDRGVDWENAGGISITLVGWGYWQGNALGVFLAGLLFGWANRRLVAMESRERGLSIVRIGYSFLVPAVVLTPENPQSYLNTIVLNLGMLFATALWMRPSSRSRAPSTLGAARKA